MRKKTSRKGELKQNTDPAGYKLVYLFRNEIKKSIRNDFERLK